MGRKAEGEGVGDIWHTTAHSSCSLYGEKHEAMITQYSLSSQSSSPFTEPELKTPLQCQPGDNTLVKIKY